MDENEKNGFTADVSEISNNTDEKYKMKFDSVFEDNTSSCDAHEQMKRDYLKAIYNDDMECLNKEVRLTRTQYLKKYAEIEESYDNQIKSAKKKIWIFAGIFTVALIISVVLFDLSGTYKEIFIKLSAEAHSNYVNPEEKRGYWAASGLFGSLSWFVFVLGLTQLLYFGWGVYKNIKHLKKHKERSVNRLEEQKKENMLLGTYDAGK